MLSVDQNKGFMYQVGDFDLHLTAQVFTFPLYIALAISIVPLDQEKNYHIDFVINYNLLDLYCGMNGTLWTY